MIVKPPQRSASSETSVLPLINIVFLLLIFFMVVGTLTQRPPFAVDPPATQYADHRVELTEKVLSIDAGGDLALGGQRLSRDQLAGKLSDWPPDEPLKLRADGDLTSRQLGELLALLRENGVRSVELLTRHQSS